MFNRRFASHVRHAAPGCCKAGIGYTFNKLSTIPGEPPVGDVLIERVGTAVILSVDVRFTKEWVETALARVLATSSRRAPARPASRY